MRFQLGYLKASSMLLYHFEVVNDELWFVFDGWFNHVAGESKGIGTIGYERIAIHA